MLWIKLNLRFFGIIVQHYFHQSEALQRLIPLTSDQFTHLALSTILQFR